MPSRLSGDNVMAGGTRGGRRPGAGRKAIDGGARVTFSVRISRKASEAAEHLRKSGVNLGKELDEWLVETAERQPDLQNTDP